MAEDGEIVWAVIEPVSGLILVHDDIKGPVQAVFHGPVSPNDLAQTLGGHWCTEEIISGFHGCLGRDLADANDFADRCEPRPAVVFLEPVDGSGDRGCAGLDAAMVAIDCGMDGDRLGGGIVEKSADIIMQGALIPLEGL